MKTKSSKSSKKTRTVLTAREKMLKRKEELLRKSEQGAIIFIKEGVHRIRLKSPGADEEIGIEIIQFYLGKDLGSVISPATFNDPCPFMEEYKRLKESSRESDMELAKSLIPRRRYVIGGIGYKDEKGKEIDPEKIDKGFLITKAIYQEIIDLYLDEDDWGDMTDSKEGYDIKISRVGTGMTDTVYSVSPCQKKPIKDKQLKGEIDLEGIVRAQIKSYDDLEEVLANHLNSSEDSEEDDDDEDYKPKKKKVSSDKKKKKKKRSSDI